MDYNALLKKAQQKDSFQESAEINKVLRNNTYKRATKNKSDHFWHFCKNRHFLCFLEKYFFIYI